ncbi:MAG TPA: intradiol ring-cleavage dioxygenase [Coriobacteriia bacterium]
MAAVNARGKLAVAALAVALAAVTAGVSESAVAGCDGFPVTPSQIGGTHFRASPLRHSVLEAGLAGTRIRLEGVVLTSACKPIAGSRLDFWQADRKGAYDDQGTRLRSHQFTDAVGRYWLQTIVPGPYANRAPHLHVTVHARAKRPVTTMLYFPGEHLNAQDPFFDRRLLVRLRLVDHRFVAHFDFVLSR